MAYEMRSAAELRKILSENRRRKNQTVTDEDGKVDIIKSSTHSLFKSRMRGSK